MDLLSYIFVSSLNCISDVDFWPWNMSTKMVFCEKTFLSDGFVFEKVQNRILRRYLKKIFWQNQVGPDPTINIEDSYTGTVPVYDKPNSGIFSRCRFRWQALKCSCILSLSLVLCFLDKESVGVVIRETLFSIIRVHINIVHDYGPRAHGSVIVGQQPGSNIYIILHR